MNKHNWGIAYLKIILSFFVVCCHFWIRESSDIVSLYFDQLIKLAVPCFALITFFYYSNLVKIRDISMFKSRMIRLLIPYLGWPFIYFIVYLPAYKLIGSNSGEQLTFRDLGWQLLFGSSGKLNSVLWYLWDIIVISIIIFIIYYFLPERKALYCVICLNFVSIVLQYTQVNYFIFGTLPYASKYTLGRLAEVFPYSAIGIIIADSHIIENKNNMWKKIVLLTVFFVIIYTLPIFQPISNGFGYEGGKRIVLSTILVICAIILPFNLKNERIMKAIKYVEKCGLGIYCTHLAVGSISEKIMDKLDMSIPSIVHCILIWFFCLGACVLISRIPNRYIKSLVN